MEIYLFVFMPMPYPLKRDQELLVTALKPTLLPAMLAKESGRKKWLPLIKEKLLLGNTLKYPPPEKEQAH